MYFKRKIDDFLIQWKNDPAHKPLIVKVQDRLERQNRFCILRKSSITMLYI